MWFRRRKRKQNIQKQTRIQRWLSGHSNHLINTGNEGNENECENKTDKAINTTIKHYLKFHLWQEC